MTERQNLGPEAAKTLPRAVDDEDTEGNAKTLPRAVDDEDTEGNMRVR